MRFNRQEFAGSLGDLGTLLPLAIGLVQINGLSATGVFLSVGLFYILSGLYFGVPVPVQPMKVISAYAIARMLTPVEITTAGMWMGVGLLVLALTGATNALGRIVPKSAVRGVQLTTGILLLTQGVRFIIGSAPIQIQQHLAEPNLALQALGPVPIGIVLGTASILTIFLLLENKRFPAAIVVIAAGSIVGWVLGKAGTLSGFQPGFHLPSLLPFGLPSASDVVVALTVLALPQLPMTVGNAVIAQADLTREYFGPEQARRSTFTALTFSMAAANILCSLIGAMPVCHGAGGLAAHYRFGARTAGSNLIIGLFFVLLAVIIGDQAVLILSLLPFSILGALLVFSGSQLCLTITDMRERRDFFVIVMMLGVALATNLAVGFLVGLLLSYAFRSGRLKV